MEEVRATFYLSHVTKAGSAAFYEDRPEPGQKPVVHVFYLKGWAWDLMGQPVSVELTVRPVDVS